jgi:ornithine cyclodeaminase
MLLLSEADVRAVLPMADLIDAMQGALRQFSAGRVTQPVRTVLEVGPDRAYFGVMPAALDDPPVFGAKLVTVYERNHARGLPSHLATIVLNDHETGALVAIVDGRYITEARTAAVSAVSVRLLARPKASVLAIIGSGVQAHSHLEAIRLVAPLTDVRVWSPRAEHREKFARENSVRAVPDPRTAIRGADLIVLATASRVPVVDSGDVQDGAHICAVGACRPDQREMPTALIARARLFVDSRAGAMKESGDVLLPIAEGAITADHIAGELGELAASQVQGRTSDRDVTIFKSLGMAVEDVVAARLAVDRARTTHRGREIDLA